MCIVETKLVKDRELTLDAKSKYNTWRKYRKQGRGEVMMLIRQSLKVSEVSFAGQTTEVMFVRVIMKDGEKYNLIITYLPPKNNSWSKERYKTMQEDTLNALTSKMENRSSHYLFKYK